MNRCILLSYAKSTERILIKLWLASTRIRRLKFKSLRRQRSAQKLVKNNIVYIACHSYDTDKSPKSQNLQSYIIKSLKRNMK